MVSNSDAGVVDGVVYAVPKLWGTTGYAVNTAHAGDREMTTWKDFWDRTKEDFSGRTMVHDYQLTTLNTRTNHSISIPRASRARTSHCHRARTSPTNYRSARTAKNFLGKKLPRK